MVMYKKEWHLFWNETCLFVKLIMLFNFLFFYFHWLCFYCFFNVIPCFDWTAVCPVSIGGGKAISEKKSTLWKRRSLKPPLAPPCPLPRPLCPMTMKWPHSPCVTKGLAWKLKQRQRRGNGCVTQRCHDAVVPATPRVTWLYSCKSETPETRTEDGGFFSRVGDVGNWKDPECI